MSANDLLLLIALIVLAGFVGFSVISKVPNSLHTPLMSGTNAIHGIVVLGAMWVLGSVVSALTTPPLMSFLPLSCSSLLSSAR